jgi:hypothetical protein
LLSYTLKVVPRKKVQKEHLPPHRKELPSIISSRELENMLHCHMQHGSFVVWTISTIPKIKAHTSCRPTHHFMNSPPHDLTKIHLPQLQIAEIPTLYKLQRENKCILASSKHINNIDPRHSPTPKASCDFSPFSNWHDYIF